MSKKWSEHTTEEQTAIGMELAEIYEDAGFPENLKNPSVTNEYVNVLNAQNKQNTLRGLTITGKFGSDEAEMVDALKMKCEAALANVSDANVDVMIERQVGQPVGAVENAGKVYEEGKLENIVHKEGQVVWLQFWATWCPPCQPPMERNQKILEKRKEEWGDKVRIIGLSIDKDHDTVKKHCETKGWPLPEQYHVRNGKCTSDKEYGLTGVPHAAMIDKAGKIVFIGHPASRPNLEQDIDDLLNDKPITGAGTKQGGMGEEDPTAQTAKKEEKEEEMKDTIDAKTAADALEQFKKLTDDSLLTEEMKEASTGLMRAFCVLVHEQRFDCKKKAFSNKMECYKVLVGGQEKIDATKEKLKVVDDGPWKVTLREQVY